MAKLTPTSTPATKTVIVDGYINKENDQIFL